MVSPQLTHYPIDWSNKEPLSFRTPEEGEVDRAEEEDSEKGDGKDRTGQDEKTGQGWYWYIINVYLVTTLCLFTNPNPHPGAARSALVSLLS